MAKKKLNVKGAVEQRKNTPNKAVLFELENLAIQGRQLVFDVLEKILEKEDISLNLNMFSRYCSQPAVKQFLPLMLKMEPKAKGLEAKLITEISEAINNVFASDSLKLESGLTRMLKVMKDQNIMVAALSSLNDETARQLSAKLGLVDKGVILLPSSNKEKNFPSADAWLKLAKKISVSPSCCVVVATSSVSCKAALSAGMRSVVVPDKYTAFQDFGGAEQVFADFGDNAIAGIIELMKAD